MKRYMIHMAAFVALMICLYANPLVVLGTAASCLVLKKAL